MFHGPDSPRRRLFVGASYVLFLSYPWHLPCGAVCNRTDDDRRPPPTPSEEEKDDKHALLSSEQTVSPPHRQASTSDCSEQVSPAGARGFSPKQFLRGSAGAGNRNLRELEVLETTFSREQKPRGEAVLTALDMSGTTEAGYQQAPTAASPFSTDYLASSSSWPKPRLCGSVCGDCDDGGLPSRPATMAADGFDTVAKHAQYSMQGGRNSEIGERLAGEGPPPPDTGDVPSFLASVQRDRRKDGCLELSSGSETVSAFVDEEEMVVKAIKNFRLLSNTSPSKKCSTISSPRQPLGAADRALPAGGCACCNVARERCAERRVGEGNGGKGAGRKGDTENNPPAQGYGHRTSEIDSVGCPLGGTRGRAEERASGDGKRCRQSTEARDAWEGNNWILEVKNMKSNQAEGCVLLPAKTRNFRFRLFRYGRARAIPRPCKSFVLSGGRTHRLIKKFVLSFFSHHGQPQGLLQSVVPDCQFFNQNMVTHSFSTLSGMSLAYELVRPLDISCLQLLSYRTSDQRSHIR